VGPYEGPDGAKVGTHEGERLEGEKVGDSVDGVEGEKVGG